MSLKPPSSPPASSPAVAAVMRANKRAGTRPELVVRRMLHRLGYRFRIHVRELPGRPDIVLTARRKLIQVHGCFWHQHPAAACPLRSSPKSNTSYWRVKLARNVERDAEQASKLVAMGWEVLTVWECECRDQAKLTAQVTAFLGPTRHYLKNGTAPASIRELR
jgi:DNA mismatch endonuclease, patch repair protein